MRYTLFLLFLLVSISSDSQSLGESKSSLFLLKIDSSGNIATNKVASSNGHSYGYFVTRVASSIVVYCYLKDSISLDSLNYGVDTSNLFSRHVTLTFDSALKCTEINNSSTVPLNQIRKLSESGKYFVSMIADTLRVEGQNFANIRDKDIQISVFENGVLKWNRIFGTIHNDVPYSIYYDSIDASYYVTGFIGSTDTLNQDSSQEYRMIVGEKEIDSENSNLDQVFLHESLRDQPNNEKGIICKIHPNPFVDYIYIQIVTDNLDTRKKLTYRLISNSGSVVKTGIIGHGSDRINGLSNLSSGTYYLSIMDSNSNEVSRTKVIKD